MPNCLSSLALSGREVLKLALQRGFVFERQRGSHLILSRGRQLLVIPLHGETPLKKGLLLQLLREIGISREELFRH